MDWNGIVSNAGPHQGLLKHLSLKAIKLDKCFLLIP